MQNNSRAGGSRAPEAFRRASGHGCPQTLPLRGSQMAMAATAAISLCRCCSRYNILIHYYIILYCTILNHTMPYYTILYHSCIIACVPMCRCAYVHLRAPTSGPQGGYTKITITQYTNSQRDMHTDMMQHIHTYTHRRRRAQARARAGDGAPTILYSIPYYRCYTILSIQRPGR